MRTLIVDEDAPPPKKEKLKQTAIISRIAAFYRDATRRVMTGLSACLLTGLPVSLHGFQQPKCQRVSWQSAALGRAKYHVLSIRDSLPIFGQK